MVGRLWKRHGVVVGVSFSQVLPLVLAWWELISRRSMEYSTRSVTDARPYCLVRLTRVWYGILGYGMV